MKGRQRRTLTRRSVYGHDVFPDVRCGYVVLGWVSVVAAVTRGWSAVIVGLDLGSCYWLRNKSVFLFFFVSFRDVVVSCVRLWWCTIVVVFRGFTARSLLVPIGFSLEFSATKTTCNKWLISSL